MTTVEEAITAWGKLKSCASKVNRPISTDANVNFARPYARERGAIIPEPPGIQEAIRNGSVDARPQYGGLAPSGFCDYPARNTWGDVTRPLFVEMVEHFPDLEEHLCSHPPTTYLAVRDLSARYTASQKPTALSLY